MVYCWGKAEEEGEEERRKVMMPWWDKNVVFPVKRAWVAIAARVKACKHGKLTLIQTPPSRSPWHRSVRQGSGRDVGNGEEIGVQRIPAAEASAWRPSACAFPRDVLL
ncbi:hypothetical protein B296_00035199 [Ensete ventricosum]|uniref:Uncharacterized protein n=1 Tax=Ensete ventricosum TaxID=4639 RepID=A0A426ZSF3_ENSVE|nr:hypothetical protein B296_00035199 [Ensete ventricosum]